MRKLWYKTPRQTKPAKGEDHSKGDLTIQNETKTMRDILKSYAQTGVADTRPVSYFDEEQLDRINSYFNPGSLDLTDLESLDLKVQTLQADVEQAIERQQKAKENENISQDSQDGDKKEPVT